jgi:hypothetical protein
MLSLENSKKKEVLKTIWTLMESTGLFLLFLADLALILLEYSVRYRVWAYMSRRRFKAILRRSGLPEDLIDVLVRDYMETIRKVDALKGTITSLGNLVRFPRKFRNISRAK